MMPAQDKPAHLSIHRAFVVQFRSDTVVEQGNMAGRVEHAVTGQAADFQSLETLLAFIAQVLRAEGGELTLVDFAQPSFDLDNMEWIK